MSEDNEQIEQRRAKLSELRASGNAFPNHYRRSSLAGEIQQKFAPMDEAQLEQAEVAVAVCGRLVARRIMGKASFANIEDVSGTLQLYVRRDDLREGHYNENFKRWDVGDIIWARGRVFRTKTGELSLHVDEIELLTKALRPLPEKYHGLTDQETRYRQRYLDLVSNPEVRETFRVRSQVIGFIRRFFEQRGFLEVETPMMVPLASGAAARPFVTHHNALDMTLYLRIAPELYLKRLVVGGFERVFEINRNFRNEGLSTQHNPEFTMLEFYQAYADYKDLMDLTEKLVREAAQSVLDTTLVNYQGESIDLSKPFARLTLRDSITAFNSDIDDAVLDDAVAAGRVLEQLGGKLEKAWGLGKIQVEIFEKTVESKLRQPTFITEYPTEVSPLARRNDDNPFVTDRFEFFVTGRELANGFSELNDAEDQAERFAAQVDQRDSGDEEAMDYDEDYVVALEHGMPPTAGEGIGIDRLVMLLTDCASIRDVILFPHMRSRAAIADSADAEDSVPGTE